MNEIINIDIDMVRQMRREGKDTSKIMRTYRQEVKAQGRQAKAEEMASVRLIKKMKGICIVDCCKNKTVDGRSYCSYCLDKHRKYQ